MDATLVVGTSSVEIKVGVYLLLLNHPPFNVLRDGNDCGPPEFGLRQLD